MAGDVQLLKLLVEPHPATLRDDKDLYGMQKVTAAAAEVQPEPVQNATVSGCRSGAIWWRYRASDLLASLARP